MFYISVCFLVSTNNNRNKIMSKLAEYNVKNVSTSKQFNKAVDVVFTGISGRNNQVQQLLVLAVNEAAREAGGQVTNNLTWLSKVLAIANETKGVNATRIASYVKEVLCKNTVAWNKEKKSLKKSAQVAHLEYDIEPKTEWFNHGKADKVEAAFDYGKRVANSIMAALDDDKGGMSTGEVLQAVLKGGITSVDLGLALQFMADEAGAVEIQPNH